MHEEIKVGIKEQEYPYEYWLASMHGIGDKKKQKLREYMKSAKEAYYIEETELKKIDFLKEEEKMRFGSPKRILHLRKHGKN